MLSLDDPQTQAALQTVVLAVISLFGTVLAGLIGWVGTSLKKWLDGKANAAAFKCAVTKIETVTGRAVAEVEQTLVRQLKADGQWDADTARKARDIAVDIAKRHLGKRGLIELAGCFGHAAESTEGMLRTYVENRVDRTGSTTKGSPIVGLGLEK